MKRIKIRTLLFGVIGLTTILTSPTKSLAQSQLYPGHFNLNEVTLTDGPMKQAMLVNNKLLLEYDADRLLAPFIREARLDTEGSAYEGWLKKHPNFDNWGGAAGFDLSGHVGGHYLSALALAYAANDDPAVKQKMMERLEYMLKVLSDCSAHSSIDDNFKGFIGGQPIREAWEALAQGDITKFQRRGGWVPFYCQHKVLAGLRDAYLYTGNKTALELFRSLAEWSVNVVSRVSAEDMERILGIEHGGMNESMLDAYQLFGDKKYLDAAYKYSHKVMLNGMQTLNPTFLDGKHANTQVPKYIGFERIGELDAAAKEYRVAAENFWRDVAENRTVCIGGNSVGEHFLSKENSNRYIDHLDGPESCNSNNMLKLSEMLSDRTHDARYADFYEYTMWNHILSTQDPKTGGYVYFTTLRPQGYRIYSTVNESMWCCVGTGMENHSKYGHFIYTHDGDETLYVNLFTPSRLASKKFALTQTTNYPYEQQTRLTIDRGGKFTLAIRHPWWTTNGFAISVNGQRQNISVEQGKASYVTLQRKWRKGDMVTIDLPMQLRYEECPNYGDYVAFEYGPILLAAQTTIPDHSDNSLANLPVEVMKNEYGHEGRMDHAPGSMTASLSLTSAPLLIGSRSNVLQRIKPLDTSKLRFTIDASRTDAPSYQWKSLTLLPFYSIQHARYICYWYQQTADNYARSDMAISEAANERLQARTLDFVVPGEQQSEAGHEYNYSSDSSKGNFRSESYRDARAGGYIQYSLFNNKGVTEGLSLFCRFITTDRGRKATLTVDGETIAQIEIPARMESADRNGFFNLEFPLPKSIVTRADGTAKNKLVVKLQASNETMCPGIYYIRLLTSGAH
ncbi:MAG: glycoside hydrolase family 127 protein [Prevotella sp.]|nr:glycoside hydrolase family 127 protein [Prevotella sp.]